MKKYWRINRSFRIVLKSIEESAGDKKQVEKNRNITKDITNFKVTRKLTKKEEEKIETRCKKTTILEQIAETLRLYQTPSNRPNMRDSPEDFIIRKVHGCGGEADDIRLESRRIIMVIDFAALTALIEGGGGSFCPLRRSSNKILNFRRGCESRPPLFETGIRALRYNGAPLLAQNRVFQGTRGRG